MIELTGHKGLVVALAYSPDGRTLASASADGTARLWDLNNGKLTASLQSPMARAYCVAFSPDGKSLAVGYGGPHGLCQLWDLDSLQRSRTWAAQPRAIRGVAFNRTGDLLATAGDRPEVYLWQLDGRRVGTRSAGASAAGALTFSPDGRLLAAIMARPATIRIWEADGQLYRSAQHLSGWGYGIVFNPSGDRLAVALERDVALWNPADYRPPHIWPAHAGAVLGVAFTPDGQTLLTCGAPMAGCDTRSIGRSATSVRWRSPRTD